MKFFAIVLSFLGAYSAQADTHATFDFSRITFPETTLHLNGNETGLWITRQVLFSHGAVVADSITDSLITSFLPSTNPGDFRDHSCMVSLFYVIDNEEMAPDNLSGDVIIPSSQYALSNRESPYPLSVENPTSVSSGLPAENIPPSSYRFISFIPVNRPTNFEITRGAEITPIPIGETGHYFTKVLVSYLACVTWDQGDEPHFRENANLGNMIRNGFGDLVSFTIQ